MQELTPAEIVTELDRFIVGQLAAKRAVALALRNRWRWLQLPIEIRREITPKNILMIGPTGVGKTEITRRLASLTGAPFIKVEASKYTEVGYYGRDVESMIRDLVETALNLVRAARREEVQQQAEPLVEDRLIELLVPTPEWNSDEQQRQETDERHQRTRKKFRERLQKGQLEEHSVEIRVEQKRAPVQVLSNMGMESMDMELQGMFEKIMPKRSSERRLSVADARRILMDQEIEKLMDQDALQEEAIRLAEESGIVFIDEVDKICTSDEGGRSNSDVSRQGVQRDLLPIVEGTTVQSRYGSVRTDHMLFIAAGAFHRSRPSDLMPELQGRFPIRVELDELGRDDFVRILTEPDSSLTRQYQHLLSVENVKLEFTEDGIEALAEIAFQVNQNTQNIGARRLHTILERLLDDISFSAGERGSGQHTIDASFVRERLEEFTRDEDLSRFIL